MVIAVFLAVGIFSPMLMLEMYHDEMGSMGSCLFQVSMTNLCKMGILDHIASWQTMLVSIPPQLTIWAFFLFTLFAWAFLRYLLDPPDIANQQQFFIFPRGTLLPSFVSLLLGTTLSPRAP